MFEKLTLPAFPIGGVYLLEPEYPWAEVERDVRLMAEHGFNLITLWPAANSWCASQPDDYAFDDTMRFLDLCQQYDLQVLIQLIGQTPSQEFMPDAVLQPDMRASAPTVLSWPNLNHPAVDAEVQCYFRACVDAMGEHPAVFGWDVFNEAHFRSDDPYTVRAYWEWLRDRYGDIETLNRRWLRRYASFDQVDPVDRASFYSVWSSLLPQVEYEIFRADNLTAICRRWCQYLKALDPTRPVVVDGCSALVLGSDRALRISPDGTTARVIATGLRNAYLARDPLTGILTASDQQGNWIPSTPLLRT
ncbi:MAG: beta-galactosidase [Candidatus Synoicihabitans palmerolidicus]|nr:beta-galactosidase [Candidatus Synoicihabitans palmerolidicus]